MKDELASRDEPGSLEELISLAIHIDNHLREEKGQNRVISVGSVNLQRHLTSLASSVAASVTGTGKAAPQEMIGQHIRNCTFIVAKPPISSPPVL